TTPQAVPGPLGVPEARGHSARNADVTAAATGGRSPRHTAAVWSLCRRYSPWGRGAAVQRKQPARPRVAYRASSPSSREIVGEIPSAEAAGVEPDEQVVAGGLLRVPVTCLPAEVTRGNSADDRSVFRHAQARPPAKLEAAVRRALVVNDDAGARVSS